MTRAARAQAGPALEDRLGALPWPALESELDSRGFTRVPQLLTQEECALLMDMYRDSRRFRSKVVMEHHGYGRGEYQYFCDPLPELVERLRSAAYGGLVPLANRWAERMGEPRRFPAAHAELRAQCRAAGQTRPTPLLLRYGADDYNCLHQDLYGEIVFPLQLTVLLSAPGEEFSGGELLVTEQRPRMQSRAEVIPLARGDAALFAVRQRPVQGSRGTYRVNMRHGVSRIREGQRYALGVIFHDAS